MVQVTVGVSLKTYFGRRQAAEWFDQIADRLRVHDAVLTGAVRVFVIPTYLQIEDAKRSFAGTPVKIGAQDVSAYPPGAYTGEITAAELAETGVSYAEIGHAERRRLFGDTDDVIARKTSVTLENGIVPVLCLGEENRENATAAAKATLQQLHEALTSAPAGPVVVAYEPVWAIGAPQPAPTDHITEVTRALRAALLGLAGRDDSVVIYGGSAGPGLLTRLGDDVDGLFLGRFAHDPDAFVAVLDEATTLAARRTDLATS